MNTTETFPIILTKNPRINSLDFDKLNFGREFSDHMFIAEFENGEWTGVKIMPFQDLSFSPASCVFHYGQAIFEGMKAYKTKHGEIVLFRPEENWKRLNRSAVRMSMPEIPKNLFMNGIKELVNLDSDWIPEGENKALYIRPFMIADDAFLGVKPSQSYKFMIITSPTANYYKGAVSVKIETEYSRAAPGGIGSVKAAANYAASLLPARLANNAGYDQLIWTDAKEHKYLEESGTMNLMIIINNKILTPSLESKTILPGITRDSVLKLAREWGYEVEERRIPVEELIHALENKTVKEIFGVGTAATIAPIKRIGFEGVDYELEDATNWDFANRTVAYLKQLRRGDIEDKFNWLVAL